MYISCRALTVRCMVYKTRLKILFIILLLNTQKYITPVCPASIVFFTLLLASDFYFRQVTLALLIMCVCVCVYLYMPTQTPED